ncbi:MAG: hypothetical protein ACTSQS_16010, partial [Promethearchaeota archaeon]
IIPQQKRSQKNRRTSNKNPSRIESTRPPKKRGKSKVVRVISSHTFHMGKDKEEYKKGEKG